MRKPRVDRESQRLTKRHGVSRGAFRGIAIALGLLAAFFAAVNLNFAGGSNPSAGVFVPAFSVSPASSDSSTWYCSLPSMSKFPGQSVVLHLTNTVDRSLRAKVRISQGGSIKTLAIKVAPKSDVSMPLTLSAKAASGISIAFAGGGSLAGLTISGPNGYSQEYCQPSPGPSWIVEGLSTAGNSIGAVSVYNPFGTDSIVDMKLLTGQGSQSPGPLQAVVLAPGASISVNLLDWEQGQRPIAISINTRLGRVVVGGIELRSDSSASGIAFAPATAETFNHYNFPLLNQTSNQSVVLDLYNFSASRQRVKVAIQALNQSGTTTSTLASSTTAGSAKTGFDEAIPAQTAVSIPLKAIASVPVGTLFSLAVGVNGDVSAIVTLAGSSLGPASGLFLESGANQSWPRWLSMLYGAPSSQSYSHLAVLFRAPSRGATALLTRNLRVLPPASSNAVLPADAPTGVVLTSTPDQANILGTSNTGGFPASFRMTSSKMAIFAIAFIGPDGSLTPLASIPTD